MTVSWKGRLLSPSLALRAFKTTSISFVSMEHTSTYSVALKGGRCNVHQVEKGGRFVAIVWGPFSKNDDILRNPVGGAFLRAKTKEGAAKEAMRVLFRYYPL